MSDKNGTPAEKPTVEELRAEIKQTRAELGETVQALAAKADVKARAKEQVEHTKQRVLAQAADAGGKVRDAAAVATGRVRTAAAQTAEKVRDNDHLPASGTEVRERVRNAPVPLSLVFAGVVAVVGVILIMRGSRR
jgi:hypothetical protein